MAIKKPYLIQRGTILARAKKLKLSQAVDLDYMGSAEFEFGALPESLRYIEKNFHQYNLSVIEKIVKENSLYIFANFSSEQEKEEYINYLILIKENKITLKEPVGFCDARDYYKEDFWWDIKNSILFSYDKKFMKALKNILQSSFDYMNKKA